MVRLEVNLQADADSRSGLLFNVAAATMVQQGHAVMLDTTGDEPLLIGGYYDGAGQFVYQARQRVDPQVIASGVALVVVIQNDSYAAWVNGRAVVKNVPLVYGDGYPGLVATGSDVVFDDVLVTRDITVEAIEAPVMPSRPTPTPLPPLAQSGAAEVAFDDSQAQAVGDAVYRSTFAGEIGDSDWVVETGDWRFDEALLVQMAPEGFDYRVVYRQRFDAVHLKVVLRHVAGYGGGILFNLPSTESMVGGHLIRFDENGEAIFWGYFDQEQIFNGQGFANLTPPGSAWQLLEVVVQGDSYSIWLNNQQVASSIPLRNRNGHIALSSSNSVVAFRNVDVFGADDLALPTDQQLFDFDTISGEWRISDRDVQQVNTVPADYILGTGVDAERYTLDVDIVIPQRADNLDLGGGLILHMPDPQLKNGAHLVRFGNQGESIFWGYFDDDERLVGQGNAPILPQEDRRYALTVSVARNSFSLAVNQQIIATDIPLERTQGLLGLATFGGPITFENFRMTLGDGETSPATME